MKISCRTSSSIAIARGTGLGGDLGVVRLLIALALFMAIPLEPSYSQQVEIAAKQGAFDRAPVIERLGLRPPRQGGVYVVAHRGAHQGIPENSLPAYSRAIELGVDFVEVDIRLTKDDVPVSIHDDSLDDYVAGATDRVRDLTLAELREFDIGIKHGERWRGVRVPTFEEILNLCRGKCGIYLDLKEAPVAPLVEMIRKRGLERGVLWYASPEELQEVVRLCPECITMPDPGPHAHLAELVERLRPSVIASTWRHYSAEFADECHKSGALVIVDESDPTCWTELLSWGTDGIQTDHPAELIERLQRGR